MDPNSPTLKASPIVIAEKKGPTLENRIDEFKAILENTANLSDRRQTVNDIFVGLNSLFLTGLAFLFITSHLQNWWTTAAFGGVTVLTSLINGVWWTLASRYRTLIQMRYSLLEEMEKQIQTLGEYPEYTVTIKGARGKTFAAKTRFGTLALEHALHDQGAAVYGFTRVESRLITLFTESP